MYAIKAYCGYFQQYRIPLYIVTCISDYRRGLAWQLDLLTAYTINAYLQAIQLYRCCTQFTVHRQTRTRILRLH
jgi:hypothetical protein